MKPRTSTRPRPPFSGNIIGIDPGAYRLGFAVIRANCPGHDLTHSGLYGLDQDPDEPYQLYRRRLIEHWVEKIPSIVEQYEPRRVMFETLPAVGSGNFIGPQSELAKTACITWQVMLTKLNVRWGELAAVTVKKAVTGNHQATKAKIRQAVVAKFPQILDGHAKLGDLSFDECDAVAVALAGAGYTTE